MAALLRHSSTFKSLHQQPTLSLFYRRWFNCCISNYFSDNDILNRYRNKLLKKAAVINSSSSNTNDIDVERKMKDMLLNASKNRMKSPLECMDPSTAGDYLRKEGSMVDDEKLKRQQYMRSVLTNTRNMTENNNDGGQRNVLSLDSIMKVDLIRNESPMRISEIWREWHRNKTSICAVIKQDQCEILKASAREWPRFVIPVPKQEGFELFYVQFKWPQCVATSLLDFKTHQENARPVLTMVIYTELLLDAGIALMSGDLDDQRLSPTEAQFIANQVQLYYLAAEGSERRALVESFNRGSSKFDYSKLIKHVEHPVNGAS